MSDVATTDPQAATRAEVEKIHAETRALISDAVRRFQGDDTVAAMEALDLRDECRDLRDCLPRDGVFEEIRETLGRVETFLTSRVAVLSSRSFPTMIGTLALAASLC